MAAVAAPISMAVIGMPGHGKSTFLNGIVQDRKAFKTAPGSGSCTQEVLKKTFTLEYEGMTYVVDLVDTMGFPDPNPAKAAGYYDSVIECCNQELNAIVWLVRAERELHTLVEQYKVLMREFNNASPPIYVVVNGLENYADDEERDENKPRDLQSSLDFGMSISKAAGIEIAKVIPGAEKNDLKTIVRENLAVSLVGTFKRSSNMKTFTVLQQEMEALKSEEAQAENELQKQREAERRKRANVEAARANWQALQERKSKFGWIPIVGKITDAVYDWQIEAAENHAKLQEQLLQGFQEEAQQSSGNLAHLVKVAKASFEAFMSLKLALLG